MGDIRITDGTAIVLADSVEPYAGDLGARTDQLDLGGLTNTSARQSAKVDLTANRAREYAVFAAIEFNTGPADGTTMEFYWAPSPDSSAGVANPGGVSGSDSAYTGSTASTLTESLEQLELIGVMPCLNDLTTTVQFFHVGTLTALLRYGSLVVVNNSGVTLVADSVEHAVLLQPLMDNAA
jgi:hypothetical protein